MPQSSLPLALRYGECLSGSAAPAATLPVPPLNVVWTGILRACAPHFLCGTIRLRAARAQVLPSPASGHPAGLYGCHSYPR